MLPGQIASRYFRFLTVALVLVVMAWSGWQPKDRFIWFLEVTPVLIGLTLLVLAFRRFPPDSNGLRVAGALAYRP